MLKSPGFTAVAILSLALGIGANTSIFSVINAVLLRSLPYKNPDQLTMVFIEREQPGKDKEASDVWSYPKFEALRDSSQAFEQIAVVSEQNFPLTDTDSPERLSAEMVSASYFPMLGVEAVQGRTFAPEEDKTPGANPVALLSYKLWQRRYGADPNVIGKTISLNKVPLGNRGRIARTLQRPEGHDRSMGSCDDGSAAHFSAPPSNAVRSLDASHRAGKTRRHSRASARRDGNSSREDQRSHTRSA